MNQKVPAFKCCKLYSCLWCQDFSWDLKRCSNCKRLVPPEVRYLTVENSETFEAKVDKARPLFHNPPVSHSCLVQLGLAHLNILISPFLNRYPTFKVDMLYSAPRASASQAIWRHATFVAAALKTMIQLSILRLNSSTQRKSCLPMILIW